MSNEPNASLPEPAPIPDWFSPGRFALVLAVLVFAAFPEVLLGSGTFVTRDFGLFSFPAAYFHRESFWRGEIPLWNPLNCCGLPFLAQLNTLTLYPLTIIYLLLPLTWSLPFFCLCHLYLGGLGMYFLASRWSGSGAGGAVAGVMFAFNGLALNFLMWPSHIATFAWMPWVILLAEDAWQTGGRKIILAALAAAMEVLAGGPETILFTWLILLAMALIQAWKGSVPPLVLGRRFFAVGFVALGLTAAELLPFADLAIHSSRNTGYGGAAWSMPPYGWANFLVPLFQTNSWQKTVVQNGQYWTASYYSGIGAVFLIVIALWRKRGWRVWLTAGLLVLSLVLALGNEGHLYPLLKKFIPIFGLFRYPVKFVILTSWAMPVLAAFAIGDYENREPGRTGCWRLEIICVGVIAMLIGVILWFARFYPLGDTPWAKTLGNGLWRGGFLCLFAVLLYLFATRAGGRGWSGWGLVAVCWLDLITQIPRQNPAVDAAIYQPGLARMSAQFNPMPATGESRLMMSPFAARELYYQSSASPKDAYLTDRAVFLADCNLLDGVPKVDGFFSLYLRETDKLIALFDETTLGRLSGLEDLLGVSQTIAPGKIFDWVARPSYLPGVTTGQAPVFVSDEMALYSVTQSNADFRKIIYLPPAAQEIITAKSEPAARILSSQFTSTKVIIEVATPRPAMVFISQAYYHNWKAYVDGQEARLWRANYAFQAVEAPAGRHELTLRYEDRAFWCGAIVSSAGLAGCLAGWVLLKPRRKAGV